jgi:hypothetical protein
LQFIDITYTGNHQKKLSKLIKSFKSYNPPKNSTATVEMGGALGRRMTDSDKEKHFLMMPLGKFIFHQKLEH